MSKSNRIVHNGLVIKVTDEDRFLLAEFSSSNLQALAYNVIDRELIALFRSNTSDRYVYQDVPAKTFFKIMSSESVGSIFSKLIVKGGFEYYSEANK